MQVLSMGFKKPQDGDQGDVFFDAIAFDVQQLNDHTHNGTNSQLLATQTQSIVSGSWAAAPIGGGVYRQLVTVPAGYSFDTASIWFKISTGVVIYPSVERVSSVTYYIYVNDNTLNLTAYYR